MSELPKYRYEKLKAEKATTENIRQAFADWETNPIGGDPYIAQIGIAAADLIDSYQPFRNTIDFLVEAKNDPSGYFRKLMMPGESVTQGRILTSEYAANLVRCAIQYNFLRFPSDKSFPRDYQDAAAIKETIVSWYEDKPEGYLEDSRADVLEMNLMYRIIQTNIPERYKGVQIARYVLGDEFPAEVYGLDVGSSMGEGWSQLAMVEDYPFDHFEAMAVDPATGLAIPSPHQTEIINREINRPLPIGYSMGVDLTNPKDPREVETSNWIWSNRRPMELIDRQLINKDYALATASLPTLGFIRGNFAKTRDKDEVRAEIQKLWPEKPQKLNLVTIFTAAYESSDQEVSILLDHAAELLDEDGLLLLQEPVDIDPSAPNGLRFYDDFRIPFVYKLVAIWPHKPERGVRVLAAYDSGRCRSAIINPGV